jgi:hypothetical protein
VGLVQALQEADELEELRDARKHFAQTFPLSPGTNILVHFHRVLGQNILNDVS